MHSFIDTFIHALICFQTVSIAFAMEKSSHFSDAAVAGNYAQNSAQEKPEVTAVSDFAYFDELQREPMTTRDMVSFTFLVAFPAFFFIVAVVLMHVYND